LERHALTKKSGEKREKKPRHEGGAYFFARKEEKAHRKTRKNAFHPQKTASYRKNADSAGKIPYTVCTGEREVIRLKVEIRITPGEKEPRAVLFTDEITPEIRRAAA
jgi:hypothetical protein